MPPTALADFFNALRPRLAGELRTDLYSRTLYSTDASNYRVMPYGVLIPQTVDDIQAALELAGPYRLPVLPRAAGTSLAGQAVNQALIIDVSRHLDKVLEINAAERWARVQPGLVLDDLNQQLKPLGLQFGPDPASSNRATLGGIVANNASGSHSIVYGMAADHLLETGVILSDGHRAAFGPLTPHELRQRQQLTRPEGDIYRRIAALVQHQADTIRTGTPRHWRRCGGYNLDRLVSGVTLYNQPEIQLDQPAPPFNLAQLICGSEGTLAIITDLKLNLVPRPRHTVLALIHFDQLYPALTAVPAILETGPAAVELLDNLGLTMCRQQPEYARLLQTFIQGQPYCLLIVEYTGDSEAELTAQINRLTTRVGAGLTITPLLLPQLQQNVWIVRKVGLGLLMSLRSQVKPIPFIEDAAVPVAHLADYVSQIEHFCRELGTELTLYAHASAGCLHIRPLINLKLADEAAKLPRIAAFSAQLVSGYGGAISSEHGDGRSRSWLNERVYGPELYGLFRQVKQAFDPDNLLNPGNIVDLTPDQRPEVLPTADIYAHPMTAHLRYGPDHRPLLVKEHLDFSADQGLLGAIEMCNGAGVCRKLTTGSMCPSFMATRDEEHSTRGRANALRAALSGGLPAAEFTSRRMFEVLDLCIECKACKAECPSAVDMAKIKFEFLAHYYEHHPIPLRVRLLAHIARWSRLSSGWPAPLVNMLLKADPLRWGLDKFLGISRQRSLPPFAREPFTIWFKKHRQQLPVSSEQLLVKSDQLSPGGRRSMVGGHRSTVVLFNDTFNTYNYPHVAIAATEVLEAAGFEVILPDHRCCGRPMISKGLFGSARQAALETVGRLYPLAQQGLPIVGLEPSCLLSLRDEYLALLPDDPRVKRVAEQCYTFEEFMAHLADTGQLKLEFMDTVKPVLLHSHCHQKALGGTESNRRILSLPPGYTVTQVDSACCGMAGAFGYEVEHYEISLTMGERRLFPAVRQQPEEAIIVAAGVSCRQQIKHGTGRQALHPAEALRQALRE